MTLLACHLIISSELNWCSKGSWRSLRNRRERVWMIWGLEGVLISTESPTDQRQWQGWVHRRRWVVSLFTWRLSTCLPIICLPIAEMPSDALSRWHETVDGGKMPRYRQNKATRGACVVRRLCALIHTSCLFLHRLSARGLLSGDLGGNREGSAPASWESWACCKKLKGDKGCQWSMVSVSAGRGDKGGEKKGKWWTQWAQKALLNVSHWWSTVNQDIFQKVYLWTNLYLSLKKVNVVLIQS